jgi:hypothetical protein
MKATLATLNIRRHLVTMAAAVVVTVGSAAGAGAQQAAGPREGIKVHGHWIIEVTNPDGTRAQYREFENALLAQGGEALSSILAGQLVPSTWFVWLGSEVSTMGPCTLAAASVPCASTTPIGAQGAVATAYFPTLTISAPTTGPNSGKLVLSGSVTSTYAQPSNIGSVQTRVRMCPASHLAGVACPASTFEKFFSQATVSPAIAIVPGQIIQVTVIFSFS